MLKLLYKTLLVSILSCSLLMLNFNSTGFSFQSAQAESVKTEGIKDGDMMATLTMVGVGILSSRLFLCKMTTDMMVAAAAGVVYLAGEVLATIKLKKVMKDLDTEITRDSKGNINDEQIKDLERLKKSYEEAKKTAGMKKMLQMAAAAAYVAAAVLALTQNVVNKNALSQCMAGSILAAHGCAAVPGMQPAAALVTAATAEVEASEVKADTTPDPSAAAATVEEVVVTGGLYKYVTAKALCIGAVGAEAPCIGAIGIRKLSRGVCLIPLAITSNDLILQKILGKDLYASTKLYTPIAPDNSILKLVKNTFISEAKADLFSPMGIVGLAAIAYVTLISKTLGILIDTMLFSPMKRGIIWGVLGGLVFMASRSTDSQIKKLDANIKKIDDILKGMNQLAVGTATTQVNAAINSKANTSGPNGTKSNLNVDGSTYEPIDLAKDGNGALPCFTGNSDNGNCKSLQDVAKDLPSYAGLNLESQKKIDGILKVGDGFNGKSNITSAALSGASSLAGSANALNANANAAKKKLIADLNASGSKINVDAMSKKFADDMEKSVRAALVKSGSTPSGMMGSLYGGGSGSNGSSSSSSEDAAKLAAEKAAADAAAKRAAAAGGNVYDMQAGAGATAGSGDAGLSGLNSGKTSADATAPAGLLSSADALKDLELDHNDISTDTKANLFELISNRYQQSGYRRLFKLKETQEEAPVKN